ncbi:unnamed protein product [Peniophora sp. CBMAI 1063]|nr:unnamed protein product [Peniophora sp. CBMAI 1063]
MCFGTFVNEADALELAHTELEIFRGPRSIGQPLRAAIPLLDFAHQMLRPVHGVLKTFHLMESLDDTRRCDEASKSIREVEIGYAARLKEDLHARIRAGDATPSQLGDVLRFGNGPLTSADEYKIALSLMTSGTGVGALVLWLVGLLASRPDLQAAAHTAIRAEYGDADPDPLDTGRVEYISALVTKAGRYFASITLGFPRETIEDVEVNGVLIPRGTIVMHNTFSINRDPARYDRPDEFLPER